MDNKDIICPYCGYTNEDSNFPDLFWEGWSNDLHIKQQLQNLKELHQLGYNVATCGNCGLPFIQKL